MSNVITSVYETKTASAGPATQADPDQPRVSSALPPQVFDERQSKMNTSRRPGPERGEESVPPITATECQE